MNKDTGKKTTKITICLPISVAAALRSASQDTGYKISKLVEKGVVLLLKQLDN